MALQERIDDWQLHPSRYYRLMWEAVNLIEMWKNSEQYDQDKIARRIVQIESKIQSDFEGADSEREGYLRSAFPR